MDKVGGGPKKLIRGEGGQPKWIIFFGKFRDFCMHIFRWYLDYISIYRDIKIKTKLNKFNRCTWVVGCFNIKKKLL